MLPMLTRDRNQLLLFVGVLKDKTGSYASCFVFGGTTLLSVCVLMTVVNLVKCRRHPASVENHDR